MKFTGLKKTIAVLTLGTVITTGMASTMAFADAAPDGKTIASTTQAAKNGAYTKWKKDWESVKEDWTQVSLTPGKNDTELNFAWYSTNKDAKLVISKKKDMSNPVQTIKIKGTKAAETEEEVYYSCKAVVKKLKKGGTYYYQAENKQVVKFQMPDTKEGFEFIYVGDPQIGSSNELKGQDSEEFYAAQSSAVCNDSFNWNNTLNQAKIKSPKASFVLSAGDQIQTTLKKAPLQSATNSEIEYAGYLSPKQLKSLPVATTVGNHDADNPNYLNHFNIPNLSELGSNGIVGGDYYYTYGDALFIMLNTQDTNVAEHKKFIESTVKKNQDKKWRIVTLHQDIYGSGEHSNEPEITNLRYSLVPIFEENSIDVVLTGHDHAYSRTQILKGGTKTVEYSENDFDEMLEKDIENGSGKPLFVAPENIKSDTKDPKEIEYLAYLDKVMDANAVVKAKVSKNTVVNPKGILYMTASSSSGSKYYDLVPRMQSYVASRWQEDIPTYSIIKVTKDTFTINTYRTDNGSKIDEPFSIKKTGK